MEKAQAEGLLYTDRRPVLIYDGDCSFCIAWVDFWRSLTGDSLEYLPYQQASVRFPDVPIEDCRKAVQFITPEGRFPGAEGVCRFLASVPGYRWLYWCYRYVPGFAALAALTYRFIANHRSPAWRFTRALWGEHIERSTYRTASELFSRTIAIIYAVAFLSFGLQVRGLVGSEGILPAREFLDAVHQQLGGTAWWRLPTLFWWGSADVTLLSIAWGGVALALISLLTKAHSGRQRLIFIVLWAYYLSIVNAGQIFMGYQWDWLLVETGFLAIFLQPAKSRLWLFRWLIFRLMLESGAVKLLSGDQTWRHFTALNFHYWTQPLPTPLAWYANLAPGWFQSISVGFVFAVELVVPFLMLAPRRLRHFAGYRDHCVSVPDLSDGQLYVLQSADDCVVPVSVRRSAFRALEAQAQAGNWPCAKRVCNGSSLDSGWIPLGRRNRVYGFG